MEADISYGDIVDTQDSIALTKLLRRVCRKEIGNFYVINTYIVSMLDVLSCIQNADTTIDFMTLIKLKYDILETQFSKDWIPAALKTAVITMHPDKAWSGETHDECNIEDQSKIDHYTKNWSFAHIGVRGSNARSNGILLKDHLHKNATTNNNTATSYPSDLTALTDRIISYPDSTSQK